DVIEQPGDLGGGEIRIEQQAGSSGYFRFMPAVAQSSAPLRRAPILPHNGVVNWASSRAVPNDSGFTLIGDADRSNIFRACSRLGECRTHGRERCRPYVLGVMLNEARGRVDLRKFLLRADY